MLPRGAVGRLDCWSVGLLDCWKVGRLEGWKVGRLESWKVGKLESWTVGKLESWKVGRLGRGQGSGVRGQGSGVREKEAREAPHASRRTIKKFRQQLGSGFLCCRKGLCPGGVCRGGQLDGSTVGQLGRGGVKRLIRYASRLTQ